MTRGKAPVIAEPPWVWGPSEVNAWIRAAHPSKRRPAHAVREGPDVVSRLRIVVEGSDARSVRAATEEALDSVGVSPWKGRSRHGVVESVRASLVGERLHVALRFAPPIHVSSCQRIVEQLGRQVEIHAVSVREERARLRAKPP